MKHRIFLDINLRHWKYEKYCGGWMLLGMLRPPTADSLLAVSITEKQKNWTF